MARTATAEKPSEQRPQAQPQPQPQVQPGQAQVQPKADEGTQAARPPHPIVAFKNYLGERMSELQFALPPHISPDRFTRVALTALQRKPELLKCTKQSLWNACLLAAQDGLLPDGREGAIVPYGENAAGKKVAEIATWMPMVEGLRKKARNSGEILNWEVHIVRARDAFHVSLGDTPKIDHDPYFGPDDPGSIVGAYSIAWLKDGAISRDVMTIRDLEKIKAKSRAQKGPWADPTFYPEMCKKTVARRHYKQLPHSSDLDAMIQRDDIAFGLEDRTEDQIADRQTKRLTSASAAFDQFASAPLIEHEAGEGEPALPTSELDGEFDDDTPSQSQPEPQPTDAKQAPAEKEHKPAEQQPEPEKQPETVKTEAATAAWPKDQVPKTADDYRLYATAYIAAETNADAIAPWFKSEGERKLRNACNVTKDTFDAVKTLAANRISALKN